MVNGVTRAALREAERLLYISSWYEDDGQVRAIPRQGRPVKIRSVRDVEKIIEESKRRSAK